MATISNLYIDQGSDYSSTITVKTSTGQPLDLTEYTAKSQIRKSYGSQQAYDFVCENAEPTSGKIKLIMSAESTELIKSGRWLYDVEITNINTNMRKRVVEGIVEITPQITRV